MPKLLNFRHACLYLYFMDRHIFWQFITSDRYLIINIRIRYSKYRYTHKYRQTHTNTYRQKAKNKTIMKDVCNKM